MEEEKTTEAVEPKRVKVQAGDILKHRLTDRQMLVMGRFIDALDTVLCKWEVDGGGFHTAPMFLWEFEGFDMPEKTPMFNLQQAPTPPVPGPKDK